jgi:flagellar hook assembly protein FlgD
MMAQLAQFSSLEQMNNLNASFRTLSAEIDRLNFVSASSLIGRTVSGTDAQGVLTEGKVEQVYLNPENGDVYVTIGTTPVALANLQRINGTAA